MTRQVPNYFCGHKKTTRHSFSLGILALTACGLYTLPAQATCTDISGNGGSVIGGTGGCIIQNSYYSNTSTIPIVLNAIPGSTITFQNSVAVDTGGTLDHNTGALASGAYYTSNGDHAIYAKGEDANLVFERDLRVDNTYQTSTPSGSTYGEALKIGSGSGTGGASVHVKGNLIANSSGPNYGTVYVFDAHGSHRSTLTVDGNYTSVNTGDGSSSLFALTGGLIDIGGKVDIKVIGSGSAYNNSNNSYGIVAQGWTGNAPTLGAVLYSTVNFGGGTIDMVSASPPGPTATSNSAIRAIQMGNINVNGDLAVTTNGWYARGLYVSGVNSTGNNYSISPSTITLGSAGNPITTTINTTGLGANGIDAGKTDNGTGQGTGIVDVSSGSTLNITTTGIYASPIKIEYKSSNVDASTASSVNISSAYTALMYGRGPDGIGQPGMSNDLNVSLNNATISTTFTAADQNTTDSNWTLWQMSSTVALTNLDPLATVGGDTCQGIITGSSVYSGPPPTSRSCALISVRGSQTSALNLTSDSTGSTVVTASADTALIDVGDGDALASSFTLNADGQNTTINGAAEVHDTSTLAINLSNGATWNLTPCTNCSANSGPTVTPMPTTSSFTTLNVYSGSVFNTGADNFSLIGQVNIGDATSGGTLSLLDSTGNAHRTLSIVGDLTITSAASNLNVASDATNIVQQNGSSSTIISVSDNATLAGTLNLAGEGTRPEKATDIYNNSLTPKIVIDVLRSTLVIQGDFDNIQNFNLADRRDYLNFTGNIVDISALGVGNYISEYDVSQGLSWLANNTKATGHFTLPAASDSFNVDIPLSDQNPAPNTASWDGRSLDKEGLGTLTLSALNTYTGATSIGQGVLKLSGAGDISSSASLNLNNPGSTFDVSAVSAGVTTVQNLQGVQGSAVVMAGKNMIVQSSSDTLYAGNFDASTGSLIKEGTATLTLSGKTAWTGDTQLKAGTLILDGSTGGAQLVSNIVGEANSALTLQNGAALTGTIDPSNVTLDTTSTWNMTSSSIVQNLTHAGKINFTNTSAPGNTLTVQGDFIGNGGTVGLNTVLGDDTSITDKVIVQGSTSGAAKLAIHNVGGVGAQTVQGIKVVQVTGNSAATFTLAGRAVAGAYEYSLGQVGNDWYLSSKMSNGCDVTDPNSGCDTPEYRPESGGYLANRDAANAMFIQTMHDRLGEPQFTDDVRTGTHAGSGWVRTSASKTKAEGAGGDISESSRDNMLQVGADLIGWQKQDNRLHAGLMFGVGSAHTKSEAANNPAVARGEVNGYSFGLYGTWFNNKDTQKTGLYLDGWMQYGHYNNKVNGSQLDDVSYSSQNFMGSVETGYAFLVKQKEDTLWYLEPQAQVIYTTYHQDDVIESNGTHVSSQNNNDITTRLGGRFYGRSKMANGNIIQPFVALNWWHGQSNSAMSMNNTTVTQNDPKNRYEAKVGVQAEIHKNWNVWGNLGLQVGSHSYSSFEGQAGVKYIW